MRRSTLGVLACSLSMAAASSAEAQPAQPPPQQPPIAQQQPPIAGGAQVVTTSGGGSQPTIIVIQGGGQSAFPRKRRTMPAEEGQAPPAGYHADTQMIKGLVIGGWTTFGSAYVLTLIGGAVVGLSNSCGLHALGSNCSSAANDSGYIAFIPIAGPWIYTANGGFAGASRFYFGFMGILQAAGLGMAIGGMAGHVNVWVSDEAKNKYGPRIGIGPGNVSVTTNF